MVDDHLLTELACGKQKREHNRIVDEQSRRISEVVAREVEGRANLEHLLRERAETDVELAACKERVRSLTSDLDKLRKQVHDLQQESADKEVKLLHANKQAGQYREDMAGMNLALAAKQQEVELVRA